MKAPLVSIVVPTFNRQRWIGECLGSVKAQRYPHIEALVIDDGSTDGTVERLRRNPDFGFVRLHVQPRNDGASRARNAGIAMARGELIAFVDSDDRLAPNHVERAVDAFMSRPDIGLFACDSTLIDSAGETLHGGRTWHQIQSDLKNYPLRSGPRTLADVFAFSNIFPGFTIRKCVFDDVGLFDQAVFPMDDYDLMLRVAGAGYTVYYCHEPLAQRREHEGQCSGPAHAVDTCRKQLLVLDACLRRHPELRKGPLVRKRMA